MVPGHLPGIDQTPLGGLILSGGETAHFVCQVLQVDAIELSGEIEPGVPWGRLRGGPADGLPVVTKAGGFGQEATLVDAVDWLSKREPQS
jgi:uncharacterized protein YgbK (DUF1537 family)